MSDYPPIVLVTGSRMASDLSLLYGALAVIHHQHRDAVLFVGDADGAAHTAAIIWALRLNNYKTVEAAIKDGVIRRFDANWAGPCRPACDPFHRRPSPRGDGDYCPAAGHYRNNNMCQAAAAAGSRVISLAVFKAGAGNRGTGDCVEAMRRHRLPGPVKLTERKQAA